MSDSLEGEVGTLRCCCGRNMAEYELPLLWPEEAMAVCAIEERCWWWVGSG